MTDIEVAAPQKKIANKKRVFPDGKKLSKYKKYDEWTYRKWAWEFLCRNEKFIEACDQVKNEDESEKAKIAKEFGLVKFKNYSDFQTRANVFPLFKGGTIKSIENIGNTSINSTIRVSSGYAYIRFKITSEVDPQHGMAAQIDRAKIRLFKFLDKFQAEKGSYGPSENIKKEPNIQTLIEYLRILDLKSNGINNSEEMAKYIHEGNPDGLDVYLESWAKGIRRKIPEAVKYQHRHYRYLALRLGKPEKLP